MKGETQLSGRVTFLVVGSVFVAVTIGMAALGIHLYRTNATATAMAACVVFAWGFGSMVVAMMLVLLTSGRQTKGNVGVRRGRVSIRLNNGSPGSSGHMTGGGVEAEGEAGTRITSPLPSVFLMLSSIGLAVLGLFLFGHHRLDVIGSGMFVVFVIYIANWSRLAWPRKVTGATANKSTR
ncbi:hypothetical protein [Rhizobium sp. P44RR-XXIV]|uniref:hypothetical protein n=1 Tax=Rhizobium sp. P44RR-XXIV TaxID=1921145 RepID=UPI000984FD0F|nr:hypothetical protein [Rhizobium sp. P44RR-XXIV]TIX86816.1 hypothetical protein BSK43_028045 [Rhizobium sp. P44RR-XXIV]